MASTTKVDGALTVAAMSVPGTLGGSGTVHGDVALQPGSVPAPQSSSGTLTVNGNMSLGDGSIYDWEVSSTPSDLIHVTGNLDFGTSAILNVMLCGADLPASGDYLLFEADGTIDQLPTWTINLPPGATSGGVSVAGDRVILNNLAVPEPGDVWLLVMVGGMMAVRRRDA